MCLLLGLGNGLFRQPFVGCKGVQVGEVALGLAQNVGGGKDLHGSPLGLGLGGEGVVVRLGLPAALGLLSLFTGGVGLKPGFQLQPPGVQSLALLSGLLGLTEDGPLPLQGGVHLGELFGQFGNEAHPAVDPPAVEPVLEPSFHLGEGDLLLA